MHLARSFGNWALHLKHFVAGRLDLVARHAQRQGNENVQVVYFDPFRFDDFVPAPIIEGDPVAWPYLESGDVET
jgi:hypothetical protein